jgi:NADP-dependent 3-hydroxy acid dehydrogenase YdfG
MSALAGRLAVVTGASRGIGLACARALAEAGASVVRLARSLADGTHDGFHDFACDLTDSRQVVSATTRLLGEWGTPHILVNNAGDFLLKPFERPASNVKASFLVGEALLPAMVGAGRGSVITIGCSSEHHAYPENAANPASKLGLSGLHEALVAEYRESGLRFTLVSPGPTDTQFWDSAGPDHRPGSRKRAEMLHADDVAEAVLFAATRHSRATIEWLRIMPNPGATES